MSIHINSPDDFDKLDREFANLLRLFPIFARDINRVRTTVNTHRDNCSRILVTVRRTKNQAHLKELQKEIDAINAIMSTISQYTLIAMLSR